MSIHAADMERDGAPAYLVYWHEVSTGNLLVYGDVVWNAADLRAAVLALARVHRVDVQAAAAREPVLDELIATIDGTDPREAARWDRVTRDRVRALVGLGPMERPDPMYDQGCVPTMCMAVEDNDRGSGVLRPAPSLTPRPEFQRRDERATGKRGRRSPRDNASAELPSILYACGCGGEGSGGCTSSLQCSDGNFCTTDLCSGSPLQCHYYADQDGTVCDDDGNPCSKHVCDGMSCTIQRVFGECEADGNPCTRGVCDIGACLGEGPVLDGTACPSDNNPCTDDVCMAGTCQHVVSLGNSCNDGNACTANDQCIVQGETATCAGALIQCDDGQFCNGMETCNPGIGCIPGSTDDACDDGIECTVDTCIEPGGWCENTPDASLCGDSFCNPAFCSAASGCIAEAIPCPASFCDEQLGQCLACIENEPCDDGNGCTENDTCVASTTAGGSICLGDPIDCDDGIACTVDRCFNGICESVDDIAMCNDGDDCTWDSCDRALNQCANVPLVLLPDLCEPEGSYVTAVVPELLLVNDDDDNGNGNAGYLDRNRMNTIDNELKRRLYPGYRKGIMAFSR